MGYHQCHLKSPRDTAVYILHYLLCWVRSQSNSQSRGSEAAVWLWKLRLKVITRLNASKVLQTIWNLFLLLISLLTNGKKESFENSCFNWQLCTISRAAKPRALIQGLRSSIRSHCRSWCSFCTRNQRASEGKAKRDGNKFRFHPSLGNMLYVHGAPLGDNRAGLIKPPPALWRERPC